MEAFSGFAEKNGFPDKPPALPNLGLADMIAGLSGAFATLAAVRDLLALTRAEAEQWGLIVRESRMKVD